MEGLVESYSCDGSSVKRAHLTDKQTEAVVGRRSVQIFVNEVTIFIMQFLIKYSISYD